MLITFQIVLIIVILISLVFAFADGERKESRFNATLLCTVGILAFMVSMLVL